VSVNEKLVEFMKLNGLTELNTNKEVGEYTIYISIEKNEVDEGEE
jgi:hypothetical protein